MQAFDVVSRQIFNTEDFPVEEGQSFSRQKANCNSKM